jgi:urease subunit beta
MYASNKVTIYREIDFNGNSKELDEGEYNIYDLGLGISDNIVGDNKLSSLTVPAGMKVILYEYEDFRGRSKTFTRNVKNLTKVKIEGGNVLNNSFDNRTSSIRIEKIRMTAGQIVITDPEPIKLNAKQEKHAIKLEVTNLGDRPIQVGSHFHFYEVNEGHQYLDPQKKPVTVKGLEFDRERTKGMHLNIIAGTAIRFEPGDKKEVELVPFLGTREIYGFNGKVNGSVDKK